MAEVHGIARGLDWQSASNLRATLSKLGLRVQSRIDDNGKYVINWQSPGLEPVCYRCKPEEQCPRSGYCENRQ